MNLSNIIFLCLLLWPFLIMPRVVKRPNLSEIRRYDYAHRGYHNKKIGIPENSLLAFKCAVENGFGIELDVHLSKDGHLIVIHDESLSRTCGQEAYIYNLSLQQIKFYRLENTRQTIPTLEEVLKLVNGTVPIIIELKPTRENTNKLCEEVAKVMEGYDGVYCVESFDIRAVHWFKKYRPDTIRGQLSMNFRGDKRFNIVVRFVMTNLLTNIWARPDFIAYKFQDRGNLSLRLCRYLYNIQEIDWTIRSFEEQKEAKDGGATVIFEGFDAGEGREESKI